MTVHVEVIGARDATVQALDPETFDGASTVHDVLEELPEGHRAIAIGYDEVVVIVGTPAELLQLAHKILTAARLGRARGEGAAGG